MAKKPTRPRAAAQRPASTPTRVVEAALTVVGKTEIEADGGYGGFEGPEFARYMLWRVGLQNASKANDELREAAEVNRARWQKRADELNRPGQSKKAIVGQIEAVEQRDKGDAAASFATIYKRVHLK